MGGLTRYIQLELTIVSSRRQLRLDVVHNLAAAPSSADHGAVAPAQASMASLAAQRGLQTTSLSGLFEAPFGTKIPLPKKFVDPSFQKPCFGSHLCPKLTWDFELDCSQSDYVILCGYPHPFVVFVNSPEASMISLWTSVCRGADNDQHLRKFQAGVASFLTLGGSKKSYTASKGTVKVKHWMSQGLSQHQA